MFKIKRAVILGMVTLSLGAGSLLAANTVQNDNATPGNGNAPCGLYLGANRSMRGNRNFGRGPARRRDPEMEKLDVALDEKRIEIRKELIKDSPDWSKIEKIKIEIATEKAKANTKFMKERFEEMKKAEKDEAEKAKTSQSN